MIIMFSNCIVYIPILFQLGIYTIGSTNKRLNIILRKKVTENLKDVKEAKNHFKSRYFHQT